MDFSHDFGAPATYLGEQGDAHYAFDFLRATVSLEGDVQLAPMFASALAGSGRCGDGWVFASANGVIAVADSFLGPLQRVGQVSYEDLTTLILSYGSTALILNRGRLFSLSCDSLGDARLTPVPVVDVRDAATDGDTVVAITPSETHIRIRDRGWSPVDVGSEVPESVFEHEGELIIATDSRWLKIANDGSLVPVPRGLRQRTVAVSQERRHRDRRLAQTAMQLAGVRPLARGPEGSVVYCDADLGLMVKFASGSTQAVDAECEVVPAPDSLFAIRRGRVGHLVIDPGAETVMFQDRASLPRNAGAVAVSDEWLLLWQSAGCASSLCWLRLATGELNPFASVRRDAHQIGVGEAFVRHDGRWHRASAGSNYLDLLPSPFDEHIVVGGDGSLWTHESNSRNEVRRLLRLGSSGTQRIEVPDGCRSYWVESESSVLVREHATGNYWRTTDGGGSWHSVRRDPRVRGYAFNYPSYDVRGASCRTPCATDDGLLDTAPPSFQQSSILGLETAPRRDERDATGSLRCTDEGDAYPGEESALGRLSISQRRPQRAVVRWRGLDSRGRFMGETETSQQDGIGRALSTSRHAIVYSLTRFEPIGDGLRALQRSLRRSLTEGADVELLDQEVSTVLLRTDGSGAWARGTSGNGGSLGAWDEHGVRRGERRFAETGYPALVGELPAMFFPWDAGNSAGSLAFLDPSTPPRELQLPLPMESCVGAARHDVEWYRVPGSSVGLGVTSAVVVRHGDEMCIRSVEPSHYTRSELHSVGDGGFRGLQSLPPFERTVLQVDEVDERTRETLEDARVLLDSACFARFPDFEGTLTIRVDRHGHLRGVRQRSLPRTLRICVARTFEGKAVDLALAGGTFRYEVAEARPTMLQPIHCEIYRQP